MEVINKLKTLTLFIAFVACIVTEAQCAVFRMEVENFAARSMRRPRSGASGNFTVAMTNDELVEIEFCLQTPSHVSVRNVVLSNDGPVDTLHVSIDNRRLGTIQSPFLQDNGNGWNRFTSSGPLDGRVMVSTGRHIVRLKANTDEWGVEVDFLEMAAGDRDLQYEDIICNMFCSDVRYDDVPRKDSIPSARFVQKSISTLCSEQDNVKVEVYHDTATDFDITANLPKYQSFANNRDPSYDNCVLASPYWAFYNETITSNPRYSINGSAHLSFSGTPSKSLLTVTFNFRKMTPTREVDERFVGTAMFVKLKNLHRENVRVKPEYLKGGNWFSLPSKEFTPFSNSHRWVVPDRTWDVSEENVIRVYVEPGKQQVVLDTFLLERQTKRDTTVDLYSDTQVVFQGVKMGFWHHWMDHPESMSIFITNNDKQRKEYYKMDSVRLYAKVPWTGGYSQVFVLFQDGRVRLQTITPHGLDYIPFGSSINIGQPRNTANHRPYSPIRRVAIDTASRRLDLTYEDGNKLAMYVETTFSGTTLKIREAVFRKDRALFPIMTFQSMWINDGKSDTDHVTINGGISRHIISDWRELYGVQAVFFRKCISSHNTQAPDITIKILSD